MDDAYYLAHNRRGATTKMLLHITLQDLTYLPEDYIVF